MEKPTTQLAVRMETVKDLFERNKTALAEALPRHIEPERLMRTALTSFRKNPALLKASPASLLSCVLQSAALGLEPDTGLGEAYVIPYGKVATFIPGYRGLIKLAYNSGEIASIYAEIVHEGDRFKVIKGLQRNLIHEPMEGAPAGKEVKAVYAVAKMRDTAADPIWVVLWRDEIDRIRDRYSKAKGGPWKDEYEAMAKKTAVRQLVKWLPLSAEKRVELDRVVALDEEAELGQQRLDVELFPDEVAESETAEKTMETVEGIKSQLIITNSDSTEILYNEGFDANGDPIDAVRHPEPVETITHPVTTDAPEPESVTTATIPDPPLETEEQKAQHPPTTRTDMSESSIPVDGSWLPESGPELLKNLPVYFNQVANRQISAGQIKGLGERIERMRSPGIRAVCMAAADVQVSNGVMYWELFPLYFKQAINNKVIKLTDYSYAPENLETILQKLNARINKDANPGNPRPKKNPLGKMVKCPDRGGDKMAQTFCDEKCNKRQGCPAWDDIPF